MLMVDDTVHLWWADSRDIEARVNSDGAAWLSDAEWQAIQAKIPAIRARALAAKWFVKSILAKYAHMPPNALCFRHNAYGKPALIGVPWHFNLSHSEHYLVLAICAQAEVGVDVQTMRDSIEALDIAKRFFHGSEYAWLRQLPASEQRPWFYRLWAAKEAVLKAAGVGIGASGLKDLVLMPDQSDKLGLKIDVTASSASLQIYQLQELFMFSDCALSLATRGLVQNLQTFHWQGTLQ